MKSLSSDNVSLPDGASTGSDVIITFAVVYTVANSALQPTDTQDPLDNVDVTSLENGSKKIQLRR